MLINGFASVYVLIYIVALIALLVLVVLAIWALVLSIKALNKYLATPPFPPARDTPAFTPPVVD